MNDATIFKVLRFIVIVLNVKSLFVFRKRETVSSIDILQTEKKPNQDWAETGKKIQEIRERKTIRTMKVS